MTRARDQAKAHLEHIITLTRHLQEGEAAARVELEELPLEILVRSGWRRPDEEVGTPQEYQILLATGGPAVRIVGTLDCWGWPISAVLEYADWGKPWTAYPADAAEGQALLEFARQFYYGG